MDGNMQNNLINNLYYKLDAQDKIINTQALEIARLKEDKKKAIEYIKKHSNCSGYFEDGKMIIDNIESIYGGYELLEILGEKENE